MTSLALPTQGVQAPRVEVQPLFHSSAGDDAVSFVREVAGMDLMPWQEYVLAKGLNQQKRLSRNGMPLWAAEDVVGTVPRQNGKGEIIIAREIAGFFMLRERLIIHTAHEFKTAKEGMKKLQRVVQSTPDLAEQVMFKTGNTEPGMYLLMDDPKEQPAQALQFLARSGGSGRGFSADCLIMDEAYAASTDEADALEPTMGAMPNPQTWWFSSAGFAYSEVLRAFREQALEDDSSGLAYFEWSVDEDDFDPSDVQGWAQANPSLGYLISLDYLQGRYRKAKKRDTLPGFAREHLGVWEMKAMDSKIKEGEWVACRERDSVIRDDRVTVALEVGDDRRASIAVAGATFDGRVQSEVVWNGEAGPEIVDVMLRLEENWDVLGNVLDASGPAGAWLSQIAEAGLEVKALGSRGLAQASGAHYEKVKARGLVHIGQAVLDQAAMASKPKKVGDLWAYDRRSEIADMSPLLSTVLAVSHFSYIVGVEVQEMQEDDNNFSWVW